MSAGIYGLTILPFDTPVRSWHHRHCNPTAVAISICPNQSAWQTANCIHDNRCSMLAHTIPRFGANFLQQFFFFNAPFARNEIMKAATCPFRVCVCVSEMCGAGWLQCAMHIHFARTLCVLLTERARARALAPVSFRFRSNISIVDALIITCIKIYI